MAHHTQNTERIEIENGQLVRIVTAAWGNYSLDVLKEYEDGTYMGRNLYFSQMAGWMVEFPDEIVRMPYTRERYHKELEEWCKYYPCKMWCGSRIPFDKEKIIAERPDLKYFLKKWHGGIYSELLELLRHYKKYPNIETLIDKGLHKLALNTNLQRLSKPKLSKVINFIKDNEGMNNNTMLKDIQCCIKNNIRFEDYERFKAANGDMELFKYWRNKKIEVSFYRDYISMCKKVGHNLDDPYWKYPNDIYKAHNKVMEQVKNIELSNGKIREGLLVEVTKNMAKYDSIIDGYRIFVPNKLDDIKKQCDVLYQCLLRNNYVNKMINQEEVLVFIWKDDTPIATAQVFYEPNANGELIGQFYGDERGHGEGLDCKPSQEVQAAFEKWFKTVEIKKRRFVHTKKYYKGFFSKDGDAFVGYNNFHFELGKTYETYADDDTILKTGSDCNATDKVFHFCDSIDEIFKHYTPNEGLFCEVQALGPVVENNGALLSNRIRLLRQLTTQEIAQLRVA